MSLVFGSTFSGIEAASVAWSPLGWRCAFVSEIAKFPCAVLAHRFPNVPNYGDILNYESWPDTRIDVLCGGPPCQSDSVAGKRGGMADPRGALKAKYVGVVRRFLPRWVLFEGVPGVRSVDGGGAFGALIGELAQLGYGLAWTSLDAQYFGVAQRRERVFAVGYLGAWQPAAAVLFDPEGLRGDSPPRRETREGVAGTLSARASAGGGLGTDFELGGGLQLAHALTASGFDASEDGTGRGTPIVPVLSGALSARDHKGTNSGVDQGPPLLVVPFDETQIASPGNRSKPKPGDAAPTLARGARPPSIAFNARQDSVVSVEGRPPLDTDGSTVAVSGRTGVRRLTPRECERLQGFPDDWTLVPYRGKPAADGPRYAACGNSWAVPVARWIGGRIQIVHEALHGADSFNP